MLQDPVAAVVLIENLDNVAPDAVPTRSTALAAQKCVDLIEVHEHAEAVLEAGEFTLCASAL